MQIVAKNKFDQNVYDKISKGADALEIHLDQSFVENPMYWDEQIVQDVPIVAVHAPLLYKESDTNIEVFGNRKILVDTCNFARRIADTQGHSVMIVCHLGTRPKDLKALGIYEDLVFFMKDLANAYEQLEFAIENVTPFDNSTSIASGHIGFRAVDFDSSVILTKDINHPRVGTCLDTCHALMTIRALNAAAEYLKIDKNGSDDVIQYGIEVFFEINKNTIKWLHLANAKSHGIENDHGLPFTDDADDIEMLKKILFLYNKYQYNCPITIEVRENDYSNAINFAETYRNIKKGINNNWFQETHGTFGQIRALWVKIKQR